MLGFARNTSTRREDTDVVGLVEEVLVVEKRLILREELHVRKHAGTRTVEQPVTVRSMRAVIERRKPRRKTETKRIARSKR